MWRELAGKLLAAVLTAAVAKGFLAWLGTVGIHPDLWVVAVLNWPTSSASAEAITWMLVGLAGILGYLFLPMLWHWLNKKPPPTPSQPSTPSVGDENVIDGDIPAGGVGSRNVILNRGDERGNVSYTKGGTAIGYGAKADQTSIAIGVGALAGKHPKKDE